MWSQAGSTHVLSFDNYKLILKKKKKEEEEEESNKFNIYKKNGVKLLFFNWGGTF